MTCWSLIISFASTIPTGTKSKDIVHRLKKTQDFFPMGNSGILWELCSELEQKEIYKNPELRTLWKKKRKVEKKKQFGLGFFSLNETEQLIAPSSGGFSACSLTLRDFTSPWSHQWDPTQNMPLRVSAKEIPVSHLTLKPGRPKLLLSRPRICEPRRPEDPKALRPHMEPALELSPSAPQHQ